MISRCLLFVMKFLLAQTATFTVAFYAIASIDLDRQYGLESIGCLKASDNVDGIFSEYVSSAYRNYFSRQSRFVLKDLSKSNLILENSKLPYYKIIEDSEILGQLAKVNRSQTLIRTRATKEGPQYRFSIEWILPPKMDVLAKEEFLLKENETTNTFSETELTSNIQSSLDRMIKKIPFLGTVTGIDNKLATINLGKKAGIKPGDTLVISTLDEVKQHPLLKEIVDWRLSPTGKLVVEQVEEDLSFCKVEEQAQGRQVYRHQKIVEIRSAPLAKVEIDENIQDSQPKKPMTQAQEWNPSTGWIRGSTWMGIFTREFSNSSSVAKSGSGFLGGTHAQGQLWLTREWFAEAGFSYAFWNLAQHDTTSGSENTINVAGSMSDFKLAAGYSYLVTGDTLGPKGWIKIGTHSISYVLPILASSSLSPSSFRSIFVGIGADLPLNRFWGGVTDLEFGAISSGSETGGTSGNMLSASDVQFFIGSYYRWKPRLMFQGGIQIYGNNGNFTKSSLSQKIITIVPSLVYYF